MVFSSFLVSNPRKALKTLLFRKSIILVTLVLVFFFLSLSSLGNASASTLQQTTDPPDQDGDGLSDDLEDTLGTDKTNKSGDKDKDGLYDFEEYLDHYGTPDDTTDTPKYNYNDSTSYGDVLDIYHYFNLSSNKTGYLRDRTYTQQNGGFTDHLLWNVNFTSIRAGGSVNNAVLYSNNLLTKVAFTGENAGGSSGGAVTYRGNILINVEFTNNYAGGGADNPVNYIDNKLINVSFSGTNAGGSLHGTISYSNNMLTNVSFSGTSAGGTHTGSSVEFSNNRFTNVSFSGPSAGRSVAFTSSYTDNLIINDGYDSDGDSLGDTWELIYHSVSGVDPLVAATESELGSNTDGDGLNLTEEARVYSSPILKDTDSDGLNDSYEVDLNTNPQLKDTDGDGLNDSYEVDLNTNPQLKDTDGDGLNDSYEQLNLSTSPILNDTDDDDLLDGWEVTYSSASGVNATDAANATELASDTDKDGLNLTREFEARTNPASNDTDSDGLPDGWEVTYHSISGVDPVVAASATELASDTDSDGLNLTGEFEASTNPASNDTDSDGLADGWEVRYSSVSGVNATVAANAIELASDTDKDGLNLTGESKANTDPTSNDTDRDGLPDGWEVRYYSISGVDPVVTANAMELASDTDKDGLNLTGEFEAGTNPASNDTDGDGLPDGWEVRYSSVSGVDPVVAATESELTSDTDGDGLTLLQEAEANTDPGTADNPMSTNTMSSTNTTASSSDGGISPILLIFLVVLLILALIAIVIVGTIVFFYKEVVGIFDKIKDKLFDEK